MKQKITFVLSLLFGLMFIFGGVGKFITLAPPPKDLPAALIKGMTAVMEVGWLMPLIGIAEIVGGILIIFPRTRALGALIIFPVMVGIFLTTVTQNINGLPMTLALAAVLIWIMYDNRERYLPLVR
jgi:putative oxidoreductase